MHQNDFDLPTTLRLRELIAEYGRMRRLDGLTPQRRGQLFNDLIGDLLKVWGVERVQTNVVGAGEIDVAFDLAGTRYLLEAKWEQNAVDYGPISKVSGRMSQRLAGTRGVILSMAGYTADALRDMLRGQQPDILLLDRTHFEAMLSGLLSPHDLFGALLDRAAYRGDILIPLVDLLVSADPPELSPFVLGDDGDQDFPVIAEITPGVKAEVVLHSPQPWAIPVDGLAITPGAQRLLLTAEPGLISVDPTTGDLDWTVPIAGCRSHALPQADGSLLVLCGETVLRWHDGEVQIVAGGFTGGSSLLWGEDDEAWVFDFKTAGRMRAGRSVTLTRLGVELGQEDRHVIDFPANIWSAVWLSGRRFFLAGDGHFGIVDLDRAISVPIDDRFVSPHPGQVGAVRINEQTVVTASRHGTLYGIQVETGETVLLARFGRTLRSCDLTTTDGTSAYSLGLIDSGLQGYYPTIVCLSV
ncbi:MAG TPA: restriction endonuclease [Pseudonocardiaceae bacterium]|nr:restriction endonuclease [Pseudonocardiaceae bacterium]